MKLLNILAFGAAAVSLASCADDFDPTYKVEKPAETSQYEYLNEYGTLKSYINYGNVGPKFRLGGALDAEKLSERGLEYSLVVSNYDEVTFGNHMKYNFVVAEDGTMDFGRIRTALEVAQKGGLKVFGHTLCWHSQQTLKWLNGLIADKKVESGGDGEAVITSLIGEADAEKGQCDNVISSENGNQVTAPVEEAPDGTKAYKVHIDANPAEAWSTQLFIKLNEPLEAGANINVKFRYYCTDERNIDTQAHGNPGSYHHWSCIGTLNAKPEWQTLEFNVSVYGEWAKDGGFITIAFNLSSTPDAADFFIDDVEVTTEKAPAASVMISVIDGEAIADQGECAYLISREPGQGDKSAPIVANPFGSGNVYKSEIGANPTNAWDSQFFLKSNKALEEGAKIRVKFDYACTDERSIETQAHGEPGSYHHYQCIGTLKAKPEWQTLEYEGTVPADWAKDGGFISVAFNLASAPGAATFYINNVVFEVESDADAIPLTPAEKDEILSAELKRWIYGMMEACDGYVTAWDVVNEAIMDGGNYGVKHGENDPDNFYWQDYLGDNYVRKAVKYAREGFAEYGGNPDELLLFVNDYNLEAAYNNTAKTDGLIRMINQWEADGETRIDGIGTQMHVSYSLDPAWQAKQEQCVVDMFTKLAASGKLVHVSELDMGIQDENGNTIKTGDLTFEQKQLMSDYYKFIITKFFEIIPKEQQYGIVQWAATDSPEGSGWRAGEPIGIWDLNYSRKPAYAGWCEGLQEGTAQ